MTINSQFFDAFPKIDYDINRNRIFEQTENVTNIFFRIGIIKKVINNLSSYYTYTVEDGESPEALAEKNYNDNNAGWIIIYANQIFDPQFDWPLGIDAFNAYIIQKYGSIENSMRQVHHVEKVITTQNLTWDTNVEKRYNITARRLTDFPPGVKFDYYVWQEDLVPYPTGPDPHVYGISGDSTTINVDNAKPGDTVDRDTFLTGGGLSVEGLTDTLEIDGDTIVTTTRASVITCYDYEYELNEKRRQINIIKPMYYARIMDEFNALTDNRPINVRRLM